MSRKRSLDRLPGIHDNRVFVGGNYDFLATLKELENYVKETSFHPILAWNYNVDLSRVREIDLRLLHNCKYAVFEISSHAGELNEIERTKDYETQPFCFYQIRDKDNNKPPSQVTSMITSYNIPFFGYSTFKELRNHIKNIFKDLERGLSSESSRYIIRNQWYPPSIKAKVLGNKRKKRKKKSRRTAKRGRKRR